MLTNTKELIEELSQNFLDFSYEANCQRAFADARDGLKPGQRACLWEMFIKGYSSNKPHVKSAKISGGTIASWWPHGDTAIYDTFARMSQSWINNIPEVDWHGANGSIQISGEPAASRYTEARLAKVTEEGMLFNIKKNNVPMRLNFSEDEEWPEVFPALMPRLMVNGCQGIGSTIANVWLPHSLKELANIINEYLNSGEIDYTKIAPSFPTGGTIINKNDLPAIYKTGKGKAIVRGKAEIKKNTILITEIPYQVYVEPLIEQIKTLVTKDELTGISNVINKSDKKKLLIEVECDIDPNSVLAQLYNKTNLQKSFSANQYALVGKTPQLLTLKEYLNIYIQHNYDCIKREYSFDLNKAEKRLEIVEGLVKALEDIDNIIALIKASESSSAAVQNLINKYSFTERQAKSIVDMKLGRLAKLEKVELNQEKEDLIKTIEDCNNVIGSIDRQKEIYLTRFNKFVAKYGDERRTELAQIDIKKSKAEREIEAIPPEKCVVIMTEGGSIKRIPITSFRTQKRNTKGVKTQEDITNSIIRTNTVDNLMIFTTKGKMYRLLVNDIPVGTNVSKGTSIKSIVPMEADEYPAVIYSIYKDTDAKFVLTTTKNGLIKKTPLEDFVNTRKKTGLAAVTLREGDSLNNVTLIKDEQLLVLTKNGYVIRFNSTEISPTGRTSQGVKAINLGEGDEVIATLPIRNMNDKLAIFSANGYGKLVELTEFSIQKRAGRGVKGGENNVAAALVSDEDALLVVGSKKSVCINAKDISTQGRNTTGVCIIKDSNIVGVSKV